MLLDKCNLKQQDTATYLLEWLKSKKLTVPNAGEDMDGATVTLIHC